MIFDDFIKKYTGKYVEYHSYGTGAINQCIDLVNQYLVEVLNLPAIIGTDAVNVPDHPIAKEHFTWIKNTPTGVPQKGDIIVWTGTWGHIAIIYEADINSFTSFDQNYPTGSPCQFVAHSYQSVKGWLRPKQNNMSNTINIAKNTFERLVKKSSWYDELVEYLSNDSNPDNTPSEQLKNIIAGLKSRASDMENRAVKAEAELENRKEQVSRLKSELTKMETLLSDTNIRLNNATKEYQKLLGEYKGKLKEKQDEVDTLAKQLGEAKIALAELEAKKEYTVLLKLGLLKLILEKK